MKIGLIETEIDPEKRNPVLIDTQDHVEKLLEIYSNKRTRNSFAHDLVVKESKVTRAVDLSKEFKGHLDRLSDEYDFDRELKIQGCPTAYATL